MRVTPAALATPRRDHLITRSGEIFQKEVVLGVDHDGTGGNVNHQIRTTAAVPIRALAVRASVGPPELAVG